MARKNNSNSEITIQKWIKDGRGAGNGKDYKPWLTTVRDVSSEGRSHRIFGHKTQRTHHLLSDLELAVFLLLEWHPETEDIREQFPLRLEDTQSLAVPYRVIIYRKEVMLFSVNNHTVRNNYCTLCAQGKP